MKKKQSLTSIELQKKVIRGILTIGALTLLIIFLFGNHGLYQLYILKKGKMDLVELILELLIQHLIGVTGIILQ